MRRWLNIEIHKMNKIHLPKRLSASSVICKERALSAKSNTRTHR